MSRFYVPKESVKGKRIYIGGKEAHHILDVMRLSVSDDVVVFDGTGNEYVGVVREASRRELEVEIKETRRAGHSENFNLTLIQAITKKDKMDYIVEKATELGVVRVAPVTTARTIPEWDESKKSDVVGRWRKIALEAAKQCGRSDVPEIGPIVEFEEAVLKPFQCPGPASGPGHIKLIAALSDKAIKLKDALKGGERGNIVVAIGPEGDYTSDEVRLAEENGFKVVSLGPRVLKSDTAGLAVLAMINYEYSR